MTAAEATAPPAPAQRTSNVPLAVNVPVLWEPDVPVQPGGVTVQEVALLLDHEIVAADAYGMLHEPDDPLQEIEAATGGGAAMLTITRAVAAEPPHPVHRAS